MDLTHAEPSQSRWVRALERALLVAGIVCLSWYGWRSYEIQRETKIITAEVQQTLGRAARAGAARVRGRRARSG